MKNLLTLGFIAFLVWLATDLDYNSGGSERERFHSIEKMMKWSPFSAHMLIQDFEIASEDGRASNLDGLNMKQIHKVAVRKRIQLYKVRMAETMNTIEKMKAEGKTEITLSLDELGSSTLPDRSSPVPMSRSQLYKMSVLTLPQLEEKMQGLKSKLDELQKEEDSFWW